MISDVCLMYFRGVLIFLLVICWSTFLFPSNLISSYFIYLIYLISYSSTFLVENFYKSRKLINACHLMSLMFLGGKYLGDLAGFLLVFHCAAMILFLFLLTTQKPNNVSGYESLTDGEKSLLEAWSIFPMFLFGLLKDVLKIAILFLPALLIYILYF